MYTENTRIYIYASILRTKNTRTRYLSIKTQRTRFLSIKQNVLAAILVAEVATIKYYQKFDRSDSHLINIRKRQTKTRYTVYRVIAKKTILNYCEKKKRKQAGNIGT